MKKLKTRQSSYMDSPRINRIILDQYLPCYLKNIQEGLKEVGEDPDSFSASMVKDIVADVIGKREELALKRLEKWQKVVEWLKTRENGVNNGPNNDCNFSPIRKSKRAFGDGCKQGTR